MTSGIPFLLRGHAKESSMEGWVENNGNIEPFARLVALKDT
jgi:hypothetical protein